MNNEKLNHEAEPSEKEDKLKRKFGFIGMFGNFLKKNSKKSEAENLKKSSGTGEVEREPKAWLLTKQMKMPEGKKARKYFEELYESWDETGATIPYKLGVSLKAFVDDKSYWFGVHRSWSINGEDFEDDPTLQAIMKEGLHNAGDASSGAIYQNPSVAKTVSKCNNMLHVAMFLKGSYKHSNGAVLVAIPSEYLDDDGNVKEGMYDKVYYTSKHGISVIRPEHLMGFVQSLGEGTTMEFKTRQEILEASKKETQ